MKPDLPIDTQILWLAAELVEKGHCKGTLAHYNESGEPIAWCAVGAIMHAQRLLASSVWPGPRLLRKIGGDSIADWNNAKERTAEEVALALRTA